MVEMPEEWPIEARNRVRGYFEALEKGKTTRVKKRHKLVWFLLGDHIHRDFDPHKGYTRVEREAILPDFIKAIKADPDEKLRTDKDIGQVFDDIVSEMAEKNLLEKKLEAPPTRPTGPGRNLRTYYEIHYYLWDGPSSDVTPDRLPEVFDELHKEFVECFFEASRQRGFIAQEGLEEKYREYLAARGEEVPERPKRPIYFLSLKRVPAKSRSRET